MCLLYCASVWRVSAWWARGSRWPPVSHVEWRNYSRIFRMMLWSWLHPMSLECKDPLIFFFSCVVNLHISPDVPTFSLTKTLQILLHISLSERRECPLPHSHQSCLCPQGLCTLVWRGPPPVNHRQTGLVLRKKHLAPYSMATSSCTKYIPTQF